MGETFAGLKRILPGIYKILVNQHGPTITIDAELVMVNWLVTLDRDVCVCHFLTSEVTGWI